MADVKSPERKHLTTLVHHLDQSLYPSGANNKSIAYVNYAIACLKLLMQGHSSKEDGYEFDFPYLDFDDEWKANDGVDPTSFLRYS
jgi:hypothetical protein